MSTLELNVSPPPHLCPRQPYIIKNLSGGLILHSLLVGRPAVIVYAVLHVSK